MHVGVEGQAALAAGVEVDRKLARAMPGLVQGESGKIRDCQV